MPGASRETLAAHGATLAFTYQGEALGKRVKPLAASVGADLVLPCDVEDTASVEAVFATLGQTWGTLDFLVHAVAFSDKTQLTGRYADTTRENFARTMLISCFSFTEAARHAAAMMPNGGAMLTLTYNGGLRAMPNYNAMGVAKAALEASVRYLAVDFGSSKIRVNAISAGPIRTLAGAGIGDAGPCLRFSSDTRHCTAASRSRISAAPDSICFRSYRAALPAKSISSIPAITSSPCRIRTRSAPITNRRRTKPRNSLSARPRERGSATTASPDAASLQR